MTSQPRAHCHKRIAEVAKEAAAELYEVVMGDNAVRAEWKRQNPGASELALRTRFVARNWGNCIPFARATLAHLLSTPIDESLKADIHEALTLDASLMHGRGRVVPLLDTLNKESTKQ
jgi:hypothetical protein